MATSSWCTDHTNSCNEEKPAHVHPRPFRTWSVNSQHSALKPVPASKNPNLLCFLDSNKRANLSAEYQTARLIPQILGHCQLCPDTLLVADVMWYSWFQLGSSFKQYQLVSHFPLHRLKSYPGTLYPLWASRRVQLNGYSGGGFGIWALRNWWQ